MVLPAMLTYAIGFTAWQSYRFITLSMLVNGRVEEYTPEIRGKDVKPGNFLPGWIIPITGDTAMGIFGPLVTYMLVAQPSIEVWGLTLIYHGMGIYDFTCGLHMADAGPAQIKQFFPGMMKIWLWSNMLLEIFAVYCMFNKEVIGFFQAGKPIDMTFNDVCTGQWLYICIFGWLLYIPGHFGILFGPADVSKKD